jgi:hypothetical protein
MQTKLYKFFKYLWLVNGILLFLFLIYGLYINLKPKKENEDFHKKPEDIIVGEKLEQARKDSLAQQGLTYVQPTDIENSTNKLMPISVLTYEEARKVKEAASSAADMAFHFFNCINIVFLDKDYKVIRRLLKKKGFITDYEIPSNYSRDDKPDTTIRNIAYLIGFEDSNKDGVLNAEDDKDLY